MAKIDMLAEQTEFLLEKQKEVLSCFKEGFDSLQSLLDKEQKKAEMVKAGTDLESFVSVKDMLKTQQEETIEDCEADIDFLEEQLRAIKQVQDMPDEKKAEELTSMMLDDTEPLIETSKFKADVEQETEETKQGFSMMLNDITTVLQDEGIKELEALLAAHMSEKETEEDEEESSCCGGSCHDCGTCNIFEEFEEVSGPNDENKKTS